MNRYFTSRCVPALAGLVGFALVVCMGIKPRPVLTAQPVVVPAGAGLSRNSANTTDKNIPITWDAAARKNIKWVAPLAQKSYGGPTVAGDKVFVGCGNGAERGGAYFKCFRVTDGQLLWQAVYEELPAAIAQDARGEGVAAAPAVEGNRVYYVNNRCELICADTEGFHDGKNDGVQDETAKGKTDADIVWRLDMIKDLDVFPHKLPTGAPLIVGDLLFVTTGNGTDAMAPQPGPRVPKPNAPSFIAVNKNTGKVVWQDNSPGENILLGQWSNPAYAEVGGKGQVIFGGGDGWLRAFEPLTGKPIWKFDCNPKAAKTGVRGGKSYLVANPVVYDNRVYVGVGAEPSTGNGGVGHFWCIDITKTGDVSPVGDNFDPKAAVNKNSALVWHFGGETPKGAARDAYIGRTIGTCAIHDGLVYVNELAGFLFCLDAKTGKMYCEYDLKDEVWGSPYCVDGKIYQATGGGDVHVFTAGKELKPLGKVEMPNENFYSTPTVADGVLYLLGTKNLYAIK